MSVVKSGIFIVGAKRTAFGTFGGKLKNFTTTELATFASVGAIKHANIAPEHIGTVIMGNAMQTHRDSAYLARHVALKVGCQISTPGLTINRLCGSGFQSIICAIHEMMFDNVGVALVGGTENMSDAPYAVRGMRYGTRFGQKYELADVLNEGLTDFHAGTPMGITAENLARKYGLSRNDCDEFALSSQQRWRKAADAKVFVDETEPVQIKGKKGMETFEVDEHPRETSMANLAKLPPAFAKDGVVTAGNASGISDGASALILATEQAVAKHKLTPLARVTGYAVAGCDPTVMGIGPVPAIDKLLNAMGKTRADLNSYFDLIEVNEAFAPQYLSVEKELKLDRGRTNVHGGAIALGHPLAASGSRIMTHLAHMIKKDPKVKRTLGSACIGGGQGVVVTLEAV